MRNGSCSKEHFEYKAKMRYSDCRKYFTGISVLHLRTIMAKVVNKIVRETGIRELFIEGGSTAAAILNELNIVSLIL